MSERSWMPMYWGDYLADTVHLSTWEHGCYVLLIAAYWAHGKPLPNDPKILARICHTTPDKLGRWGSNVLNLFSAQDGLLVHKRIEKELLRSSARSAAASANAQRRQCSRARLPQPQSQKRSPSTQQEHTVTPNGVDHGVELDLDAELFKHGKRVLGIKAGGVIVKIRDRLGVGRGLELIHEASHKENPMEYVQRVLRGRKGAGDDEWVGL